MDNASKQEGENRFKHFSMWGQCGECGCYETMYVGDGMIDEKCCSCGIIIGGGYVAE